MLLIVNLPLIGIWVRLLNVPQRMLLPGIVVFCCIGVYSVNNSAEDIFLTGVFALLGYVLLKCDFEPAPLMLGFVLGGPLEEKLRQSLIISQGDFMTFVERPVSGALLLAILLAVATATLFGLRKGAKP